MEAAAFLLRLRGAHGCFCCEFSLAERGKCWRFVCAMFSSAPRTAELPAGQHGEGGARPTPAWQRPGKEGPALPLSPGRPAPSLPAVPVPARGVCPAVRAVSRSGRELRPSALPGGRRPSRAHRHGAGAAGAALPAGGRPQRHLAARRGGSSLRDPVFPGVSRHFPVFVYFSVFISRCLFPGVSWGRC